ncbi:KN motif and ankyrin repeat domain-containing protein 1 isoform X2 [Condylostylus longicornis]|nr:KN motif and ankyrin repeat domain-containing protein 1 isoform X2 [Condylostylus longicornis]
MRSPELITEDGCFQYNSLPLQNCNCCPYGYHINLDFIQYIESKAANSEPASDGELLRRDKRRSRLSREFMLGLDNLYSIRETHSSAVQPVPEAQFESEPESPRYYNKSLYDDNLWFDSTTHSSNESPHHSLTSSLTTNSPPETSAFLHDALDEVVSDFEKTLERTKSTRRSRNQNENKRNGFCNNLTLATWDQQLKEEQYSDAIDSCINSKFSNDNAALDDSLSYLYQKPYVKHHSPNNNYMNNASRQHLTDNAKRIRELEEQVNAIPTLQRKLESLQNEKYNLQIQLRREEEEKFKLRKQLQQLPPEPPVRTSSTNVTNAIHKTNSQFTPQRISPVSLESLGSRIRTSSQSSSEISQQSSQQQIPTPPLRKIQKRDASTMCHQPTQRDVGTSITHSMATRTIGTDPTIIIGIKNALYTKQDVDNIIQRALIDHEESKQRIRRRTQITVGTQMVQAPKTEQCSVYIQTSPEKPVMKFTQSCMAKPIQHDQFVMCKPDTRSIGCSDHKTIDIFCDKCCCPKRTVSCGPDEKESKQYLAMKQMEMLGARSLTFTLGENEKLNIKRKTIATQYEKLSNDIGTQSHIQLSSIGIQNSPQFHNKSCQYSVLMHNTAKQTDTRDLIRLISSYTNTDIIEEKTPPIMNTSGCNTESLVTKELGTNTDIVRTRENWMNTKILRTRENGINTERMRTRDNETNTLPDVSAIKITKNSSSNTDDVRKRDIACGDIIKPHIHIACADNYCDSCKDAIKNLAKEFSKALTLTSVPLTPIGGGSLSPPSEQSKIPRPTTLPSPNSTRKKIVRQNTYTLPSPEEKPSEAKSATQTASEEPFPTSLDSVIKTTRITKTTIVKRRNADNDGSSLSSSPTKSDFAKIAQEIKSIEPVTASRLSQSPIRNRTGEINQPSTSFSVSQARKDSDKLIDNTNKEKDRSSIPENIDSQKKEIISIGEPSVSQSVSNKNADIFEKKSDKRIYPETSREATSRAMQNILLNQIATASAEPREKASPSKEMKAALKVINDSLQKSTSKSNNLKNANAIVQKEWFKISSVDKANPLNVEDYLDCFEDYSMLLLKYMVNLTDVNGNTAMHYAVSHGNFDIVSILLDSKVCNVNQMNNAGYTCVMLVSLAKLKNSAHRTVVQRLFQMADVNIRAKKHCQTALMLAVSHGNLDMVEMLLEAGADINIQDEDGSTSLMCAAEHGRIDIVKYLLSQSDCDSLIQDVDGSTAFKIAWQAGHRDIGLLLYVHEQMLRSKMPNQKSPVTPRHSSSSSNKQQQPQQPQSSSQQQQSHQQTQLSDRPPSPSK